jgi:cytochrome c biogenesis protein ResB
MNERNDSANADRDKFPTAGSPSEAGLFDLIWTWLNSLSVVIWVLVLIAIFSIIGTIVPQWDQVQGASAAAYLERYGAFKWGLIRFFGFHHMYSTWYFVMLNVWVAVSATVCTLKKLREALRARREIPKARSSAFYSSGKAFRQEQAIDADSATALLRASRFRVRTKVEPDGSVYIVGQRGLTRLWALVVMHFSILVVLLGVVVSWAYGVHGSIPAEPLKPTRVTVNPIKGKPGWLRAILSTHAKPITYEFVLNDFSIPMDVLKFPEEQQMVGHGDVSEFQNLVVRQYTSDLTVRVGDIEKRKENLAVNWPMHVTGLTIYQSAYRYLAPLRFEFEGRDLPSRSATTGMAFSVSERGVYEVAKAPHPGSYIVEVLDFKVGEVYDGNELVRELPPTALVRVVGKRGEHSLHLVSPDKPAVISELELKMGSSDEVVGISIFSYKYDRGTDIIYLGTILLTLGALLALWIGFDRVYVRVKDDRSDWRLVRQGLQLRLSEALDRIITRGKRVSSAEQDGTA